MIRNIEKYSFLFNCNHWVFIALILLKPSPIIFIDNLQPSKVWKCFAFHAFMKNQNAH